MSESKRRRTEINSDDLISEEDVEPLVLIAVVTIVSIIYQNIKYTGDS